MVFLQSLFKPYRESKAFHTLLNILCFITGQVFLTKSGEVGLFIGIRGPDPECKEPPVLEGIATRILSAFRVFGDGFFVSTHFTKRSNPDFPCGRYGDPLVEEVIQNRASYLRGKGASLYRFDSFIVVLLQPKWGSERLLDQLRALAREPLKALRQGFSTQKRISLLDGTITASVRTLEYAARSFIEQTAEYLQGRVLPRKEAFERYRQLINPDPRKATALLLPDDLHVDYFAADSELECHRDHLKLDNYVVKTLTLKHVPAHSYVNMFGALMGIKADLVISTDWNVIEASKAAADVRSRRRHWHNTKTSLLTQVGRDPVSPDEILMDDSKQALVEDLGNCLRTMEMGNIALGHFSLTATIFATSRDEAERVTAEVMKVVGTHDGAVNEERYNGLNAFLAGLPGGHPYNLRKLVVTNENHVDMVPWFQPAEGERTNEFLNAEYLVEFETEDQSLYYFNMHVQDVGHTLILGPTGTGKSFLLNFLLTHAQKYESVHTDLHTGPRLPLPDEAL